MPPKRSDEIRYEGWLEKFSLGRGFFSSHKWCQRYFVVNHEGIGYSRKPPHGHTNPSDLRCFIPFAKSRRNDEAQLFPVFLLDRFDAVYHPDAPDAVRRHSAEPTDSHHTSSSRHGPTRPFVFAVAFEEKKKSFLLLLRCTSAEDWAAWTAVLSLYISEGSRRTIVPVSHPLVGNRTVFPNYSKLREQMGQTCEKMYREQVCKSEPFAAFEPYDGSWGSVWYRDPDPCPSDVLLRIRRRTLGWNEGTHDRLFRATEESLHRPGKRAALVMHPQNGHEDVPKRKVNAEMDKQCMECVSVVFSAEEEAKWFSGLGVTEERQGSRAAAPGPAQRAAAQNGVPVLTPRQRNPDEDIL